MPPRPRPRPRMAAPASASLPDSQTPESSTANTVRKPSEDRDDFFIRNKGRSIKETNQRAAQVAATAQISSSLVNGSEESEDEVINEVTPKGNRRIGNKSLFGAGKPHAMPKWAKKGGIRTLLTADSDEEGNGSSDNGSTSRRRGSGDGTPSVKQTRSRSRSLTPPPELTEMERLRTQLAIQKVLRNGQEELLRRHSPPIEIDDDIDEDGEGENLDPLLRRIEQRVRNRNYDGDNSVAHSSVGPATVTVSVTWVPHPEDDVMRDRPKQSWTFSIARNDSLKVLSSRISDQALVLTKDLVLMRERKQLFTSITPQGLQVWDKVDIEACTRATYEALHIRPARSPTPAQRVADAPDHNHEGSPHLSEASAGVDDTDMKFKIVLRAAGKNNITLTVRPSTTCGKIIRAFLIVLAKQGGTAISPRKSNQVRLSVDGDKQHPDTPISDCGLEDGDMVEVVGL